MKVELLKHGTDGGLRIGITLDNDEAKAVLEVAIRIALEGLCDDQQIPEGFFDPTSIVNGFND